MLKRLSQNTFILLISNLSTAILAFFLTVLIGRGVGDEGLGRYAAVMAWIFPLTILADFGIGTLITRDLAQNRQQTQFYIHHALRWRWLFSTAIVFFIWFFAPVLSSDSHIGLRIASLLIWIDSVFGIYTAVWRAWEIMWPILVLNTGLLSLQVMGTAFVLWQKNGLDEIFIVLVIADALQLAAAWGLWRWKFKPASPLHSRRGGEVNFLQKAYPFAIGGLLATLYARLIFLLLENLTTPATVGWFAAASRFIEAARMPIFALFGALFPLLAANPTQLRHLLPRINLGLIFYGVVVALGFSLFSPLILNLTFGADFKNAVPILILLGWSLIPSLIRHNLAAVHYAVNQEQRTNLIFFAVLPVQLILGFILIQRWAGIGAAWTIICTETLLMVSLFVSYRGRAHANRDSDTRLFRQ